MKQGTSMAVFCPQDEAYRSHYKNTGAREKRTLLLDHIAMMVGTFGTMYTTANNGKINVRPITDDDGCRTQWKANNADIVVRIGDRLNIELIVTRDIVRQPHVLSVMEALQRNARKVSMFYFLWLRSRFKPDAVFPTSSELTNMTNVCFTTTSTCVSLSAAMRRHVRDAVRWRSFTIVAPTNELFKGISRSTMMAMINDETFLLSFLKRHVYVGDLGMSGSERTGKEIAISVGSPHVVMSRGVRGSGGEVVFTSSSGGKFKVVSSVQVDKGTLYIVHPLERSRGR